MASGIYMLTFSSGKYYVGKSLDLETRWKQHFNKFATGKAARPMQLEYDRCGLPETQVIFDCHRDHIDILEELLIDQLKGPDMLNSTYPQVTRTDEVAILINNSRDLLRLSTFEHLEILHRVETRVADMREEKETAENALEQMRSSGYIIDQDYRDAIALTNKFKERYFEHKRELQRLEKLSWWDRLFNYKVYV
jgi:predicted GIY-YIG superfamily endonuclease